MQVRRLGWVLVAVGVGCASQGANPGGPGAQAGEGGAPSGGASGSAATQPVEGGAGGGPSEPDDGGATNSSGVAGDDAGHASAGAAGALALGSDAGAGGEHASAGAAGAADSRDCEQKLLTKDNPYVKSLARNGLLLYWTTYGHCPVGSGDSGGKVSRIPINGGGTAAILAQKLPCPDTLAVQGDAVFWTNHPGLGVDGIIMGLPTPGADMRKLSVGGGHPTGIQADVDSVYFAELDGIDEDGIYKTNHNLDGPPQLLAEIVDADWSTPHPLVLDEKYVYWADQDFGNDPGLIQRVAKGGGIPKTMAAATDPRELAISSAGLFWIEEPTYMQVVIRVLEWKTSIPQTVIASPNAHILAAYDDTIYWVDGTYQASTLQRLRLGESEPDILVQVPSHIRAFTVDQDYLYVAVDNIDGDIIRICR